MDQSVPPPPATCYSLLSRKSKRCNFSFLHYPLFSFTRNLKLISSTNHSLLSPSARMSPLLWFLWPGLYFPSHKHYHCINHLHFVLISYTAYLCSTVSGNKSPSIYFALVGFYRHFKSRNSFRCYCHLTLVHCIYLIFLSSHFLCEEIVIVSTLSFLNYFV